MSISNIAGELLDESKKAEKLIEEEKYDEAKEVVKEMDHYLDEKDLVLGAMDNHEAIAKIRLNISELTEFIKYEMQGDAMAKVKSLNTLFHHMPKNYKIKPENIL